MLLQFWRLNYLYIEPSSPINSETPLLPTYVALVGPMLAMGKWYISSSSSSNFNSYANFSYNCKKKAKKKSPQSPAIAQKSTLRRDKQNAHVYRGQKISIFTINFIRCCCCFWQAACAVPLSLSLFLSMCCVLPHLIGLDLLWIDCFLAGKALGRMRGRREGGQSFIWKVFSFWLVKKFEFQKKFC